MNNTDLKHRVIFEDNHLLVIDKLAGELVQGDATGDVDVLKLAKEYIGKKYNKPGNVFMGLPHRLDRPTSGVVVLCRTSKALTRVSKMFRDREIDKIYHCLVEGKMEVQEGELKHQLKKDSKLNKSFISKDSDAKQAHLAYRCIKEFNHYSMLEIKLFTGRHHQIRAQLSAVGHPIKGDLKYGAKRSNRHKNFCLHAYALSMLHPITNAPITFTSNADILSEWGMV
ncbi:MAG: RluA family pseudouridine synthase [Cryomorphaceae bacterium]|nr:RluA family pseudouridine synthase [Cryomorphaceae bacterium]